HANPVTPNAAETARTRSCPPFMTSWRTKGRTTRGVSASCPPYGALSRAQGRTTRPAEVRLRDGPGVAAEQQLLQRGAVAGRLRGRGVQLIAHQRVVDRALDVAEHTHRRVPRVDVRQPRQRERVGRVL